MANVSEETEQKVGVDLEGQDKVRSVMFSSQIF